MEAVTFITADEAKAAVERCAFTTDEGRRIVHAFAGTMGADWDVESAIAYIDDALVAEGVPQIAWLDHLLWGRCLAVVNSEGRRRSFDTVTP